MNKKIDYANYPADAGSLLSDYAISRDQISEEDRRHVIEYLEDVLRSGDADRWEFTLNDVTVQGTGVDEAAYFHSRLR